MLACLTFWTGRIILRRLRRTSRIPNDAFLWKRSSMKLRKRPSLNRCFCPFPFCPSNAIINLRMSGRGVHIDDQQLASISKALADPTRFQILRKIGESKSAPTCSCVRDWTGLAPATVSHHLKELDDAGLIHMERSGKFIHITLRRDIWNAYLKRLSTL